MVLALQRLEHARVPEHLRVQALHREEHDAEFGRVGHLEVLLTDVLGEGLDGPGQGLFGRLDRRQIPGLPGIEQILVALERELAVDGQPDGLVVRRPRHAHRELDALCAARAGGDVFLVLLARQHLLEDVGELVLAEDALRLDVGQDFFEVPHSAGQRLHLAEPLVDLLEAVTDLLEGLAEPLLQGRLQLLVHGLAHLIEALAVVLAHLLQLLVDGAPHILDRLQALLALGVQLLDEVGKPVAQRFGLGLALVLHLLPELRHELGQFLALGLGRFAHFLPVRGELLAEQRLEPLHLPAEVLHRAGIRPRRARLAQGEQAGDGGEEGSESGEKGQHGRERWKGNGQVKVGVPLAEENP